MAGLKVRDIPEGETDLDKIVGDITEEDLKLPPEKEVYTLEDMVSSSCTVLNLAMTENPYGAFIKGRLANIIGDSSSGKSFLLWSIYAEAANSKSPLVNKMGLFCDEPERALGFKISKLFGKKTEKAVNLDLQSKTPGQLYLNMVKAMKGHTKYGCIYGNDSFDAIRAPSEGKVEKAADFDKENYDRKPKLASKLFGLIVQNLHDSNSVGIIISQTREKMDLSFGDRKTRSGGNALRFYSTHEVWLAVKGHIYRKGLDVGVQVRVQVKKNKITGKLREVEFPVYYDYGIDDTAACIDWMVEEEFWGKVDAEGKKVAAKEKDFLIDTCKDFINTDREALIHHIEDNKLKPKLVQIVHDCWMEREREIATKRTPRYV